MIQAKTSPDRRTGAHLKRVEQARRSAYSTGLVSYRNLKQYVNYNSINWERRLRCRDDPEAFYRTYFAPVFSLPFGDYHIDLIEAIETAIHRGGKVAIAVPRGGGKTALCRCAILRATLYGWRRFVFLIGSKENNAKQSCKFLKVQLSNNKLLRQDFPEVCEGFHRLEGKNAASYTQHYSHDENNVRPTYIYCGADEIRFPSITLRRDDAATYREHDRASLRWLRDKANWMPVNSGAIIRTAGIDGSIRGEADVHPITLEQPRPDLTLLDDVQKDQKAESPVACEKLSTLIDGAIAGLSGPDKTIASVFSCTVIREGDVSDTYLDRTLKPDWQGRRYPLVESWPLGITDIDISDDTEAGKLWNQYADERKRSLRETGTIKLASELYLANQDVMDSEFRVTWNERFDKNLEYSAQQRAMNLRFESPATFCSEYQNRPRSKTENTALLTVQQVAEKVLPGLARYQCPSETAYVVSFVDLHDEVFFYATLACSPEFGGVFIDYGTFPPYHRQKVYIHKGTVQRYNGLSHAYWQAHPDGPKYDKKRYTGRPKAPFEPKIYHALSELCGQLLAREYVVNAGTVEERAIKHTKIGVDIRWGDATDVCKRYLRTCGDPRVIGTMGHYVGATRKPFETYRRLKGWIFESQVHPTVEESRWIQRFDDSGLIYLLLDVNQWKSFLHNRLACPLGATSSVALFAGPPEQHEMFARHVVDSEHIEQVIAQGRTVDEWRWNTQRPDNDLFDCASGCMALASYCGAAVKTGAVPVRKRRKLSDMWAGKRR
jgi:hypothetical protein